ncbi:MAG: hypothetical protein HY815_06505, partial [Candidatus Riflebacteria bacterium]|nr:hypothetical protein [Candidatus Riflebacteria bacterium]
MSESSVRTELDAPAPAESTAGPDRWRRMPRAAVRQKEGDAVRQIALTAIGEDKPGIVAAVCRVLYETGGNLRDTSMTILSGEFAMILVVAVPRSLDVEELSRRFDPVRTQVGIAVF